MRAAHARLDLHFRSTWKTRSSRAGSTATHTWACWVRLPWLNSTSSSTGPARISTIRSSRADVQPEPTRSRQFSLRERDPLVSAGARLPSRWSRQRFLLSSSQRCGSARIVRPLSDSMTLQIAVLVGTGLLMGCSTGLNSNCEWPREAASVLRIHDKPDAEHLLRDVELAEELSIRFGDERWG